MGRSVRESEDVRMIGSKLESNLEHERVRKGEPGRASKRVSEKLGQKVGKQASEPANKRVSKRVYE